MAALVSKVTLSPLWLSRKADLEGDAPGQMPSLIAFSKAKD
jgi:hypothetical protein